MDADPQDTASPGQRTGQAPDIDTTTRKPPHAAQIPGWGSDLARENRPAVPMERRPPRLPGLHWHDIEPQEIHQEVFHSAERPGITPVFGTSAPPSGISGRIRKLAFGYSENDLRHWLMLLAADRVNVVEGVVSDLAHGHVPRLYAETGGRAELKHNPKAAVAKAATLAAVIGLVWWTTTSRRRSRF
ncbi:MAG: hypothetical protein ACJ8GJ_25525 [Vitreoscilla sp.]